MKIISDAILYVYRQTIQLQSVNLLILHTLQYSVSMITREEVGKCLSTCPCSLKSAVLFYFYISYLWHGYWRWSWNKNNYTTTSLRMFIFYALDPPPPHTHRHTVSLSRAHTHTQPHTQAHPTHQNTAVTYQVKYWHLYFYSRVAKGGRNGGLFTLFSLYISIYLYPNRQHS